MSVQIDFGEGFILFRDLGTVTTGAVFVPSSADADRLDGNAEANRVSFHSGVVPVWIPEGPQLRVRWEAIPDAVSRGWVFGLDNVVLSLFDAGAFEPGDFNEDGVLDDADLDALIAQTSAPTPDTQYDLDGDGSVHSTSPPAAQASLQHRRSHRALRITIGGLFLLAGRLLYHAGIGISASVRGATTLYGLTAMV